VTVLGRRLVSFNVATTQLVQEAQMGGLRGVTVLLVICFHSWLAAKSESVSPKLRVTVTLYDGVKLSSSELSRAEEEAGKIFLFAGIKLAWISGPLGSEVNDNTVSEMWNPTSLQLRIWSSAMAGNRPTSSDTLGFCLSLKNGDAVVLADVIQKHVIEPARFSNLLGLAMAHELGHLLLQSAGHSVKGIMRRTLSKEMSMDDERGYLRFTSSEAETMRNEVRRRMGLKRMLVSTDVLKPAPTSELANH